MKISISIHFLCMLKEKNDIGNTNFWITDVWKIYKE